MLALSYSHRYFLFGRWADMRCGIDALSGLVRNELHLNPLSGDIFIFINKKASHIKLLMWDRDGFALYYKRLEKGSYEIIVSDTPEISCEQLSLILQGIRLDSVKKRKRFSLPSKQG